MSSERRPPLNALDLRREKMSLESNTQGRFTDERVLLSDDEAKSPYDYVIRLM